MKIPTATVAGTPNHKELAVLRTLASLRARSLTVSVRCVASALGLAVSSVQWRLDRLREKGLVTNAAGRQYTLQLTPAGEAVAADSLGVHVAAVPVVDLPQMEDPPMIHEYAERLAKSERWTWEHPGLLARLPGVDCVLRVVYDHPAYIDDRSHALTFHTCLMHDMPEQEEEPWVTECPCEDLTLKDGVPDLDDDATRGVLFGLLMDETRKLWCAPTLDLGEGQIAFLAHRHVTSHLSVLVDYGASIAAALLDHYEGNVFRVG